MIWRWIKDRRTREPNWHIDHPFIEIEDKKNLATLCGRRISLYTFELLMTKPIHICPECEKIRKEWH